MIDGDFNAVCYECQLLANNHHGDRHEIWGRIRDNSMSLSSRPGKPTHSRGSTLDLVWSNYGAIEFMILELDSTSDHSKFVGDIPKLNQRGTAAFKPSRPYQIKDAMLSDFLNAMKEWNRGLKARQVTSKQNLEKLVDDIVKIFVEAIKAKGKKDALNSGISTP